MEKEKFEAIVLNTLKNLPDKFKDKIKNLSIVIEEKDIRAGFINQRLDYICIRKIKKTKRF